MHERSSLLQNQEEGYIPCDYSRAAQSVCKPAEVVSGGACGCVGCLIGAVLSLVGLYSGCTENDGTPKCISLGYDAGAFSTRALTRTLGFLAGIACYPCEKVSRKFYATHPSLLFSCVSKEKVDAVDFCSRPFLESPCYDSKDQVAPLREQMI